MDKKFHKYFDAINTFGYFEIIFPKKITARGGGLVKVYVVLKGGLANVYKYLQGGRGVQKVQNLVYVENGCPLT